MVKARIAKDAEEDKARAELRAMVAAGTASVAEVNAIGRAGVESWKTILDMVKARIAKDAEEEKKQ